MARVEAGMSREGGGGGGGGQPAMCVGRSENEGWRGIVRGKLACAVHALSKPRYKTRDRTMGVGRGGGGAGAVPSNKRDESSK
jgi:hypothetical protein